jgi:hypothetical protein
MWVTWVVLPMQRILHKRTLTQSPYLTHSLYICALLLKNRVHTWMKWLRAPREWNGSSCSCLYSYSIWISQQPQKMVMFIFLLHLIYVLFYSMVYVCLILWYKDENANDFWEFLSKLWKVKSFTCFCSLV